MAKVEYCPYFHKEKNDYLYCEGCRLHFSDKMMRREIVYRYCASLSGYRECPIKVALDGVYERKFEKESGGEYEREKAEKGNVGI